MKAPILIIEDSPDDYEAISESLVRAGVSKDQLVHLNSGAELAELQRQHQCICPAVILLDLNLPGLDGHAILAEIRKDEEWGLVPVVMFSTSTTPRDIKLAYDRGANSYIVKPMTVDEFELVMERFKSYWLETVHPPPLKAASSRLGQH